MGTNYYHRTDICDHCNRYKETHIGKSSAGWAFHFEGTEQIRSFADWLHTLKQGGEIYDEYGRKVDLADFNNMVEAKKNDRKITPDPNRDEWEDSEGHPFSEYEFS